MARRLCAAMLVCAAPLVAQQQGPVATRAVQGRVVKPLPGANVPVSGVWVTLHRVGADGAGPLDSMRTTADGRYVFRYRPTGSENATYFVTASHAGIAYFAPPLASADVSGGEAEITVFDTTSAPLPLRVRGRHIAAATLNGERRTLIEVYEISNDTTLTRVAGPTELPTFVAPIPDGATDVRVGEGDVASQATRTERGRLLVFAPMAPGLKQLSFSYSLGADDFPLTQPIRDSTDILEVLLEDLGSTAEGANLRNLGEVTAEGRRFQRYLSQDVPANSTVRIVMPAGPSATRFGIYVTVLTTLLALAMLGTLARVMARPRRPPLSTPTLSHADRLAREIALLDDRAAREPGEDLAIARDELKAQLVRALAGKSSAG